MKTKIIIALGLVIVLVLGITAMVGAVGGASFTTFNKHVDGDDVCKQTEINCNHYGAKEYVWLNGGPDANHLKPDGYYFFAVLEPGGQPNPNDQGGVLDKNLSDDYDLYTNRTFLVTGGEVSQNMGTHDMDSGNGKPGEVNDKPPYIRLFPYSNTTNPGGVYIMAICYIGEDGSEYPVNPRDCKYDAFKVVQGVEEKLFQFMLSGTKFNDYNKDGIFDDGEPGIEAWIITIDGTGPDGLPINETVTTGPDGYWEFYSDLYHFRGKIKQGTTDLLVCEQAQDNWVQSAIPFAPESQEADVTVEGDCYRVIIPPDGPEFAFVYDLNFGNHPQGDISGGKYYDENENGQWDEGEMWLSGWEINFEGGSLFTDADGMFFVTVDPGVFHFSEVQGAGGWSQTGNKFEQFSTTGGATVELADFAYTVNIPFDQPSTVDGLFFGNVCKLTPGGHTPGYWQNPNPGTNGAYDLLYEHPEWLQMLRALNLRAENGSDFDPQTIPEFQNWVNKTNAVNMASKLSSFVAVSYLNVEAGFTNPNIYAYGETVGYWMEYGNYLLGMDGYTPDGDSNRSEQTFVKNILDEVANNHSFVQPAPGDMCGDPYP